MITAALAIKAHLQAFAMFDFCHRSVRSSAIAVTVLQWEIGCWGRPVDLR